MAEFLDILISNNFLTELFSIFYESFVLDNPLYLLFFLMVIGFAAYLIRRSLFN